MSDTERKLGKFLTHSSTPPGRVRRGPVRWLREPSLTAYVCVQYIV